MQKGFTLSELLISLAILGLIAIFTVPKVLDATEEQQKKAIFRDTLGSIQSILINGIKDGSLNDNVDRFVYVVNRLQTQKICYTNPTAFECWPSGGIGASSSQRSFILYNGAMVKGFGNWPWDNATDFYVDYNGFAGPNVAGEDQLLLAFCIKNTCPVGVVTYRPGQTRYNQLGPQIALYEWIF